MSSISRSFIMGIFMYDKRLKPCPFCGKRVKIWRNPEKKRLEVKHAEAPDDCPIRSTWLYDKEESLIESWNQRYYRKSNNN